MSNPGEFVCYSVGYVDLGGKRRWAICEEHVGSYYQIAVLDDFDAARRERSRLAWERPAGMFDAAGNMRTWGPR